MSSTYELSIIKCSKSIHYQRFFPVPKSQGSFYAKSICDCDWLSCFAKNKNWHQLLSIHVENNFYNMGKGKLRGLYKYMYHSGSGRCKKGVKKKNPTLKTPTVFKLARNQRVLKSWLGQSFFSLSLLYSSCGDNKTMIIIVFLCQLCWYGVYWETKKVLINEWYSGTVPSTVEYYIYVRLHLFSPTLSSQDHDTSAFPLTLRTTNI